ncbi:MAG: PEP-CTERM sorting domain-containing protein [Planctomycetes bacterium]|nr:PEP-CTERM sorting domain-containing protein [Planctomycetota bacterium]
MKRFLSSCARMSRRVSAVGVADTQSLAAGKRPSFAILFVPKLLAAVLAAGLDIFAGTAEAAIVSLDAPFTISGNFGVKYLNFDGTSLTGSSSRGGNSATMQDIYSNFYFGDSFTSSNYAYDRINTRPLSFSYGDVVSAATTDFSYALSSTVPSDSSLTYFVVGFYNNVDVTSFPNSAPDNAFIANSNLAWLAVSRNGGDITVEAAGVNTVAGGSIAVGEYVAPIPEPSTCASLLAGLACGGYSMFRRRRAR